jgi:DNA helicase-2/ATP-dependent DNA helicase PcrA
MLNKEQKLAVEHFGKPLLIIAGAGTGKTETITEKCLYYIKEKNVDPKKICMLSFTRKAAKNINERIKKKSEGKHDVYYGTFHSLAYKMLKIIGWQNGFYKGEKILTEYHNSSLFEKSFKCILNEEERKKLYKNEIGSIYSIKSSYIKEVCQGTFSTESFKFNGIENWDLIKKDCVKSILSHYIRLKKQENYMDFNDILTEFYRMLTFKELREKCQQVFEYFIVDEYQDTSTIQIKILQLLIKDKNKIVAVGDPAQSIYNFIGGNIENISSFNFKDDFYGAEILKLNANYRSSQSILNVTNKISSSFFECLSNPLIAAKENENILPHFLKFQNEENEANFVVEKIKNLAEKGVKLNEIAVLSRLSSITKLIEKKLKNESIDSTRSGGSMLSDKKHVQMFIAFIECVQNIKNYAALEIMLNMFPLIGEDTTEILIEDFKAFNEKWDLDNMPPLTLGTGKRSKSFYSCWEIYKSAAKNSLLIYDSFIKLFDLYYFSGKEKDNNDMAVSYYNECKKDLEEFFESIKDSKDLNESIVNFDIKTETKESVIISTIHSAKGLEWEYVFVVGLEDGNMPMSNKSYGKVCKDERYALPVKKVMENVYREEEKRLFYVAMTRAKKGLFVTKSDNRNNEILKDSEFLTYFCPNVLLKKNEDIDCKTHIFSLK